MSQASTIINDAVDGITYTAAINGALDALLTSYSGPTAPTSPVAYQVWIDTTTGTVKRRNSSNSAWIRLGLHGGELGNAVKTGLVLECFTSQTRFDVSADDISVEGTRLGNVSEIVSTLASPGPGGIQAGSSWAIDTWYEVRLLCNDDGSLVDATAIPDGTAVVLPAGFTRSRHIGWGRTTHSSATALSLFRQQQGIAIWEEDIPVLTAGTATSFTAVGCADGIPPGVRRGYFLARTKTLAASVTADLYVRRTGGASGGIVVATSESGASGAIVVRGASSHWANLNSARQLDYRMGVANTEGALWVRGWQDDRTA